MKIVHYKEVPPILMNTDPVKHVAGRVMLGSKDGAKNFCMRQFEIGPGGFTPRHRHDWEHEVWILKGEGKVFIGETWHELKPDTAIFVPPNVEHQFRNNSDEVFSFLCLVPSVAPEM